MRPIARRRSGQVPLIAVLIVLIVIAAVIVWLLSRRAASSTRVESGGAAAVARAGEGGVFRLNVPRPTPVSRGYEECPVVGDGGDPDLNRLKNRVDSAAWYPVPFDSVVALPWPRETERARRSNWPAAAARAVARYEGTPIAVEGYLAGAKQEGPESPNCHGADADFRDWHMWLASAPGTDRTRSIVIETTPPVRAMHPEWTLPAMRALARNGDRVRVSGWLMLDPEHPDQVGKTRGTIWEIHPIMRIEVQRGGRWVDVEATTPSRSRTR